MPKCPYCLGSVLTGLRLSLYASFSSCCCCCCNARGGRRPQVDKFDDPAQADALTSVHRKIDVTTNTMQENISLLLENDSKLEEIEGKSNNMTEAADKFRASSKDLRKKVGAGGTQKVPLAPIAGP